jgi:hypothetical protein
MFQRLFPNTDFAPRARKPALFTQGVYSYGTRPEKKGPVDVAIDEIPPEGA